MKNIILTNESEIRLRSLRSRECEEINFAIKARCHVINREFEKLQRNIAGRASFAINQIGHAVQKEIDPIYAARVYTIKL